MTWCFICGQTLTDVESPCPGCGSYFPFDEQNDEQLVKELLTALGEEQPTHTSSDLVIRVGLATLLVTMLLCLGWMFGHG